MFLKHQITRRDRKLPLRVDISKVEIPGVINSEGTDGKITI